MNSTLDIIETAEATILVNEVAMAQMSTSASKKSTPVVPLKDKSIIYSDDHIAYWGANNDWPQLVDADLEMNTDLWRALDMNARALYAGGLQYSVYNYETGEISKKRIYEVDQFLFRNHSYAMRACIDFYKYANVWPQFIIQADGKIKWLTTYEAGHGRYKLQDDNGKINTLYINANWADRANYTDDDTIPVPVLDPMTTMPDNLSARKDGPRFIYPLSYPSGKTYYQLPIWNGIRNNEWLKVANEIPKLKSAIMKHQTTLKYHIKFPDYFWSWKYPDWDTFDAKKKSELKKTEFDNITAFLAGSENAGKNISTGYKVDPDTLKPYPGVEIIPIDDKMKQGLYIEDSTEASIKIFSAAGIDPTIFGFQLGKGSNLSGSDKREATNIFISFLKPHQDILLRPLDFVSWMNGWNNQEQLLMWEFTKPFLQVLNEVTPSKREIEIPDATERK